ncbi:MAG: beta-propeller fold lactonase family protein [Jatrophihabitans sp.]
MTRRAGWAALSASCALLAACTASASTHRGPSAAPGSVTPGATSSLHTASTSPPHAGLAGMPALLNPHDVYAADRPGRLSATVTRDHAYVYVPDTNSNDVYVIDQHTMRVITKVPGGNEPQHVVPSYDLRMLYVTADKPGAGGLTPIDPRTGQPGARIPVDDAYNMYFTANGQYAIVVQEAYTRLAFYNPHTWVRHDVLSIPSCLGIDHMDFSADGTRLLVSCEFANRIAIVDVATHKLIKTVRLSAAPHGMPQDVKLSPDGTLFYVADMTANGVYVLDAKTFEVIRFQPTGKGAHGLYISRDSRRMFVTNRDEGTISVINLATSRPQAKWRLPGGGSPDMGNLSADGKILWLSGRYNNVVYAINAVSGHLITKIPVGSGPHGLCVWPVPGRYSLGHTGILR